MSSYEFKIDGIYDLVTYKGLKGLELSNYAFDFRPLSLSFVGQRVFLKLFQKYFSDDVNFFLRYENENELIILSILEQVMKKVSRGRDYGNIILEFSDLKSHRYYDQFEVPFFWHYQFNGHFKEVLKSKNLKGVIFSYKDLCDLHENNLLYNHLKTFIQVKESYRQDLKVGLSLDWDANILRSIFDFLDVALISLSLNWHVEKSPRSVDYERLKKGLTFFKEAID